MSMIWLSRLKRRKRALLESPLKNVRVASPCRADWEKMTGDDRVRHCEECKLNIYNLSAMTRREAEELIAGREGRLCVRFFRRTDGTILMRDCPVGFRATVARVSRIAGAALSALMSVGFGAAQTEPIQGEVITQHSQNETGISVVVTDPQGTVVPNARVTVKEKATRKKIIGATNYQGALHLSLSNPGVYELEIASTGFKTFHKKLRIAEHKTEQLVVKLNVSGGTVTVGELLLDFSPGAKTTSQVTTTFSGSLLQQFPH